MIMELFPFVFIGKICHHQPELTKIHKKKQKKILKRFLHKNLLNHTKGYKRTLKNCKKLNLTKKNHRNSRIPMNFESNSLLQIEDETDFQSVTGDRHVSFPWC